MNGFEEDAALNPLSRSISRAQQRAQFYLDKTTPHVTARWTGLAAFILLYALRVFFLQVCTTPAFKSVYTLLKFSTECQSMALQAILSLSVIETCS